MLTILDNEKEIQSAQKHFETIIKTNLKQHKIATLGYRGESKNIEVWWSEKYKIWAGFDREEYPLRYWNAFGTQFPFTGSSNSITCEINSPKTEIRRRVSGGFAKDKKNNVFVIFRGFIRGGKPGISKVHFLNHYRGTLETVDDGGLISKVAIISSLGHKRFALHLSDFVHEIERIKYIEPKSRKHVFENERGGFSDEFSGSKKIGRFEEIEVEVDHGAVTNALAREVKQLLNDRNLRIRNTKKIDLFVEELNEKVKIIFEVKTNVLTSSYYGAIGQLIYNAATLSSSPIIVAVFPDELPPNTIKILKSIGINVLFYRWQSDCPYFIGLEKLLQKHL